ncbi:MAG: hypothetical protein HYU63_04930 [Armatimonadetes bacterium]|nr:hypothetical protein [Armatimonadota bacterium]
MKKLLFIIGLFLIIIVSPLLAQEKEFRKANVGAGFTIYSLSGGNNNYGGTINAFNLKGEQKFYQGIWAGLNYTYGTGSVKFNNLNYSDARLINLDIYMKIPFNYAAESEAQEKNLPPPPEHPFHVFFGYKNTSLSSNDIGAGKVNWENVDGMGIGIGTNYKMESVDIYGLLAVYPKMKVDNVNASVPQTAQASSKIWAYQAGVKVPLKWNENAYVNLGFQGENHVYNNTTLVYSGLLLGVSLKF